MDGSQLRRRELPSERSGSADLKTPIYIYRIRKSDKARNDTSTLADMNTASEKIRTAASPAQFAEADTIVAQYVTGTKQNRVYNYVNLATTPYWNEF
jgi:hypothetical protein